jgi:hypothetical protein
MPVTFFMTASFLQWVMTDPAWTDSRRAALIWRKPGAGRAL